MLRPSFIAAVGLFAVTLGSTGAAAADGCMCLPSEWPLDLASTPESGAAGIPASLAAAAERAQTGPFFSSDGTMLSSRVRETAADGARAPAPVEDVLWCSSPDDPRCAPVEPGPEDGPVSGRASFSGAGHGGHADPPPPSMRPMRAPVPRGGPRAGVRRRLERPPQG
ncbi:MAG TPA: hypothetical protein RMH99_21210 [Sandaracinaceae bacterium LLY-WYZ-13_1]|nr:hypothetical protein [Sandaracinaceae bacterium LLY-WYZ-13_1]